MMYLIKMRVHSLEENRKSVMQYFLRLIPCILVVLFLSASTVANAKDCFPVTFDSGEHIDIGNKVIVYYPVKKGDHYQYENRKGADIDLRPWIKPDLDEHVSLTFGRIVALPDLLADPKFPISDGTTLAERQTRFNRSFDVFVSVNSTTLKVIFSIMQKEVDMIKDAIDHGEEPSHAYARRDTKFIEEYFLAYPQSSSLLLSGWDHFGQSARLAYQAGHTEAINTALLAHQTTSEEVQRKLLAIAYAKEAYADHFLTDSFAAGHMRTPAKEFALVMSKQLTSQAVGTLLALLMHNEDNAFGLQASNARGDHWTAYGDAKCFDTVNQKNVKIMLEAVQFSADEVVNAFKTGQVVAPDQYRAFTVLPNLEELSDYVHYVDSRDKTVPMFAYVATRNDLLRRKDLSALHPKAVPLSDSDMVLHDKGHGWNGLVTLLELKLRYHPQYAKTFNPAELDALLTANGELNTQGLYLLSQLLSPEEKAIFCSDQIINPLMRNYLQCASEIAPERT